MKQLLSIVFFVLTPLLVSAPLRLTAAEPDLHRAWDDRCIDCHGHAGAFARRHLRVTDGQLHGRTRERDLKTFLGNHHAGGIDVDAVYAMLLAQASVEPRFQRECARCHGQAAAFVREHLAGAPGALRGRRSGRLVAEFLRGHADLSAEGVTFYVELLDRVHAEVVRE